MTDGDAVFVALADPTRRELLRSIVADGPRTATQLASTRDITRQAIAKHLGVLTDAGLVTPRRDGREVRFHAEVEPLATVTDWVADTTAAWDRRLGRLRTLVEQRPASRRS